MAGSVPGPTCQEEKPVVLDEGTSGLVRSPLPGTTKTPEDVSYEIGASYMQVQTSLPLNPAERQALAALRDHRQAIVDAERRFRVDRRAIAGAIAWELLENVKKWDWTRSFAPSVGFAKVHMYNWRSLTPFTTLASETEQRGYIPKRTFEERRRLLATPEGAIEYIGAIMCAIAEVTAAHGFGDIRSNPLLLTQVYQGETLSSWEARLSAKPPGSPLVPGNAMPLWLQWHLDLVEEGVGFPDLPESSAASPH